MRRLVPVLMLVLVVSFSIAISKITFAVESRLGMQVYTPDAHGIYAPTWGVSDIQGGPTALAWLPVTMNGDGKTQIVQLWDNHGQLGMQVYAPDGHGGYAPTWGVPDMHRGSPALAWLPVTMNGDGKTQIVQLWDPATATLTASPTSIMCGQSSTLSWSSINASLCTGTNFSTGNATSSPGVSVSPTETTSYSVSCTGTKTSLGNCYGERYLFYAKNYRPGPCDSDRRGRRIHACFMGNSGLRPLMLQDQNSRPHYHL